MQGLADAVYSLGSIGSTGMTGSSIFRTALGLAAPRPTGILYIEVARCLNGSGIT